jgi:hypothetical protein
MVHALQEIWRVLVTDGVLIDFRPLHSAWRLDIVVGDETVLIADGIDDTPRLPKDTSAARALDEVLAKGWFVRESESQLEHARQWQQVDEMVAFWAGTSPPLFFPDETVARAHQMRSQMDDTAYIRTVHPLTIGVYRKKS